MKSGDLIGVVNVLFLHVWHHPLTSSSDDVFWRWPQGEVGVFLGGRQNGGIHVMVGGKVGWAEERHTTILGTCDEGSHGVP
jgi:hypothetical protein